MSGSHGWVGNISEKKKKIKKQRCENRKDEQTKDNKEITSGVD